MSHGLVLKGEVMSSRYVWIAQGSAGVVTKGEARDGLGLFTDKLETCRPYVFECLHGTVLLHDTSQISLDAVTKLLLSQGGVSKLMLIEGMQAAEELHHQRLRRLVSKLQLESKALSRTPVFITPYSVAYSSGDSLRLVAHPPSKHLLRDPNHAKREAVNKLNDWFTPPGSQSAPLDIQYYAGEFTEPPSVRLSLPEMLNAIAVDGERNALFACLGLGLLYKCAPIAGLSLPKPFVAFVESRGLENVIYEKGYPVKQRAPEVLQAFRSIVPELTT